MKDVTKKKIKKTTAATILSASLLVASLNENPKYILSPTDDDNHHIEYVEEDNKKKSSRATFTIIKAFTLIPLWAIGTILLKLLAPFKSMIITFIVSFLLLSLIIYLIAKWLFPDLSFKDIFNKQTIIIIGVISLIISIANKLLLFSDKYRNYVIVVDFIVGLLCLLIVLLPIVIFKRKLEKMIA